MPSTFAICNALSEISYLFMTRTDSIPDSLAALLFLPCALRSACNIKIIWLLSQWIGVWGCIWVFILWRYPESGMMVWILHSREDDFILLADAVKTSGFEKVQGCLRIRLRLSLPGGGTYWGKHVKTRYFKAYLWFFCYFASTAILWKRIGRILTI